jgi:hypothetical protein
MDRRSSRGVAGSTVHTSIGYTFFLDAYIHGYSCYFRSAVGCWPARTTLIVFQKGGKINGGGNPRSRKFLLIQIKPISQVLVPRTAMFAQQPGMFVSLLYMHACTGVCVLLAMVKQKQRHAGFRLQPLEADGSPVWCCFGSFSLAAAKTSHSGSIIY